MIAGASERDVHQATLLFGLFLVVETARGGEPAIDGPDDEYCVPLLALRRVSGAQNQSVVLVFCPGGEILRCLRGLERQRRQERGAIGVTGGDDLQLIEVGESWLDAIVTLAQNVVVHQPNASDVS